MEGDSEATDGGGLFAGIASGLFVAIGAAHAAASHERIAADAALTYAAAATDIPVDLLRLRVPELPIALTDLAATRDGWGALACMFFADNPRLPTEH